MFSKELENLIQATLEDGVLEEYEKAALVKRAQAEGVDLTELEIYINSILQKRKRELAQANDAKQEQLDQKKKEAFGRICPNCGRQVPPMTIKCECGYEFTGQNHITSSQLLFDKLSNVNLTESDEKSIRSSDREKQEGLRRLYEARKKVDIITTFPVPNTKEDIIEFLSLAISGANKKLGFMEKKRNRYIVVFLLGIVIPLLGWMLGYIIMIEDAPAACVEEYLVNAWRTKFEQVLIKGRSLRGDAEFTQQLDYYESLLKGKE